MIGRKLVAAFTGLVCAGAVLAAPPAAGGPPQPARAYEPPRRDLPSAVQEDIDLAYLTLNGAVSDQHLATFLFKLSPPPPPGAGGRPGMPVRPDLPATRVFDQLYYLGMSFVTCWALDTPDGIVLFDTLENADEARRFIEGGLRSLGLDPARIRYIVVTHGHDDHYGGAKYLQDKYHARVLMTAADWELAVKTNPEHPAAGLPRRDMVAADGQTLTVGGTAITMYVTPGHTPGVLSTIFRVTDHGRPHIVSFFGGMGLNTVPDDPAAGGYAALRASLTRSAKRSLDAHADVILGDHPFTDGSYAKVQALRGDAPSATNAWAVGEGTVLRFYAASISAISAVETYLKMTYHAPTGGDRSPGKGA